MDYSYWPVGNRFVGSIPSTNGSTTPERIHHIWIVDQSGSMGWAVDQMARDMVVHLKEIKHGDTITVGYFSGVGDWRWWVKGTRLNNPSDYEAVSQVLLKNSRSRNTTCFSEILADVPTVIRDVAPFADSVELVFLTDGHPVVPNYDREHRAIFTAIKEAKSQISTGLLVGVGDYYNRPLMVEMAQALGATLQHADEIKQFSQRLGEIVVKAGKKRTTITLPKGAEAAFAIENGRVVIYAVDNNTVVAPTGTTVYFVSKDADKSQVKAPVASKTLDPYQPMYATALLHVQNGDVTEALSVLSDIGDVGIVNQLSSAMTNKEMADVEASLQEAATDLSKRFLQGQKKGCAPKEDAFDLMDLLNLLQNDKEARFYPYHSDFQYKRIGRASKTLPGYPKFIPQSDVSVPVSSLIGNAAELNISIGVNIPGTVELPDEVNGMTLQSVGLPKQFDAHIYRTYNLIANALPNVTKLPVSVGYDTFLKLHENGLVPVLAEWHRGEVFVLDLNSVPACNRARGKSSCDWEYLARTAVQSTILGNRLKVLKDKLNELDPDKEFKRPVTMTETQQKFLDACGIKPDGTYAPPSEQQEATDVLTIRTLEVKVEKASPVTVKDFQLMLKGNKKMNFVGEQMKLSDDEMQKAMPNSTGAAIQWLNTRIEELKDEKRHLDADVNARRYAIALGGYWKKHHPNPEAEYVVTSPDWKFDTTKNVTVKFVFRDDVEKKI